MDIDKFNEIKELINLMDKESKKELLAIKRMINDIISMKIQDEDIISLTFDRMLSLVFVKEKDIKKLYYKLLDYTWNFNPDLCRDYESIYLEEHDNLEETKPKVKKKKK